MRPAPLQQTHAASENPVAGRVFDPSSQQALETDKQRTTETDPKGTTAAGETQQTSGGPGQWMREKARGRKSAPGPPPRRCVLPLRSALFASWERGDSSILGTTCQAAAVTLGDPTAP